MIKALSGTLMVHGVNVVKIGKITQDDRGGYVLDITLNTDKDGLYSKLDIHVFGDRTLHIEQH